MKYSIIRLASLAILTAALALFFTHCVRDEPGIPGGIYHFTAPDFQVGVRTDWATKAQISLTVTALPEQPLLTELGLVWSNTPDPSLENGATRYTFSNVQNVVAQQYILTGLSPGATYYVRGYAIDKAGNIYLQEADFVFATQAHWTQLQDIPGPGRSNPIAFAIGDTGYLGSGYGSTGVDLWRYVPATGALTQMKNFEGAPLSGAASFSIRDKGYVAMGYPSALPGNRQLWQYDPATNDWIRKKDFGGTGREALAVFVLNDKAYLGTGENGDPNNKILNNDFWVYDPDTDEWTEIAPLPGAGRRLAVGFALGGYGYVGMGDGHTGIYNDFYQYDPTNNSWITRAPLPAVKRAFGCGFGLNGKGYFGTGSSIYSPPNQSDFWEYDPNADVWTKHKDFAGGKLSFATGFTIGNRGYIQGGRNVTNALVSDFWQFLPD